MDEKFIAICLTRFIKTLRPFLDIEKSKDPEYIKRSGKSFIGWHPTMNAGKPLWEYYRKHKLPCYFVERGALPNTVVIDRDGFLCDSSSYDESHWDRPLNEKQNEQLDSYLEHLRTSEDSLEYQKYRRMPKAQFHETLKLPDKEIIFVPLQLETDTVIKMWSGWTGGVENFYKAIQKIAFDNRDITFLVKPHPLSKFKIASDQNIINVDRFNYKDCLDYCDKVVTINSGLGLQALAWQKPVIVAGKAWYQFDGINYETGDASDLTWLLMSYLPVNREKARRFLYFLKFRLYSDCIQIKKKSSRTINRTDEVRYTDVRIFRG